MTAARDTDRPRLVLFDCDGTLVDSQRMIHEAMSRAFDDVGLPPPPIAAVRHQIGLPLERALEALLPDSTAEDRAHMVAQYRTAFFDLRTRQDAHEPLFDGVLETLDALDAEHYLLGIATGKAMRGLVATLDRHGLSDRFVTLQTADRAAPKPSPDMVLKALSETGVEAMDTVVVGDTAYDMAMARAAGTRAVAVSWGYHGPADLAGADHYLARMTDLPGVLGGLFRTPA